jgi:hypothetical protein
MSLTTTLDSLFLERPIPVKKMVTAPADASRLKEPEDFGEILEVALFNDTFDELLAFPAMALLPAWGEQGVEHLCEMIIHGPHHSTALTILTTISCGRVPTQRDVPFFPESWDQLQKYQLSQELASYALQRLHEVILDQLAEPHKKSRLLMDIASPSYFSSSHAAVDEQLDFLLNLLIDSHMLLNRTVLQQFETLLDQSPEREEALQTFFVEHPVMLDPFVAELRSKHELGDDFVTDFVVRRIDDQYVVVEIENSTDCLFTQSGAFTSDLMTAIAQVRDFQAWINDNIAYAQTARHTAS